MILSELISVLYPVDDNTELLHKGLSVEKIVGGDEEIPECHDTICLESLKIEQTRRETGTREGCPFCRPRIRC